MQAGWGNVHLVSFLLPPPDAPSRLTHSADMSLLLATHAVRALYAFQQTVLFTGTATLGAGFISSCAGGCMPILLLGRHQHMGHR